jgi:hypothetical protein
VRDKSNASAIDQDTEPEPLLEELIKYSVCLLQRYYTGTRSKKGSHYLGKLQRP